jgi:3-phosphoshikimate 1-carboxyvinyltransferase
MEVTIHRSSLSGSLQAPSSKSYTHRALFCAGLAEGESHIQSPLLCDDTIATKQALSELGVSIGWTDQSAIVNGKVKLTQPTSAIFCEESGTTLRVISAICATTPYAAKISGGPSLLRRPVKELVLALQGLGADCKSNQGYPPIQVKGPLRGGHVTVPGNVSSQYISALCLVAPLAEQPVEVTIREKLESKSYVRMTLDVQRKFGVHVETAVDLSRFHCTSQRYQTSNIEIEGDWSSAASLLAGATIAGEKVKINGLAQDSLQADQSFVSVLERMNGQLNSDSRSVAAEKSSLAPIEVDVSDSPDLFPAICALCAVADGVSEITGIRRLRIKESNRVSAMSAGLKEMGIETHELENLLTIRGGQPRSATIDPHRDHRIAMAFATLGLSTDETTIIDAECVGKSYPSFWQDIQDLGADVTAR